MRSLVTLVAMVALAACGGGETRGAPVSATATATHPHTASPSATPLINVDQMMGGFYNTQQTLFVAGQDKVSAVTLLNHFTRFEIPTAGQAQVALDPKSVWLYVLDAPGGKTRLRTFDADGGFERGKRENLASPAAGGRSLGTAFDGRVLVMRSDATRSWVDAYSAIELTPLARVAEKSGCGDRLLASAGLIAIVCLADGSMTLGLPGEPTIASVEAGPVRYVAATLAADGTIYAATAERRLAVLTVGSQKLAFYDWPGEWAGTVLPDSLAASTGAIVLAQQQADVPYARVFMSTNLTQRQSHRLSGTPQGGILMLWPLAYFTVGDSVRHIDLSTGLLEVMREGVGANAIPGAIAAR